MEKTVEIKLTPKEAAEQIWNLDSEEQAEMFEHLIELSNGSHLLMMQFLSCRDACLNREGGIHSKAMEAFQTMFASAYKYF